MKLEITLLSHGHDEGDKLCGMSGKPMSAAERAFVVAGRARGRYPKAELVYSCGISSCLETSQIIYPNIPTIVMKELRPPGFGCFDGKTTDELLHDSGFISWASSSFADRFPDGEEPYAVVARAVVAFQLITREMAAKGLKRAATISHRMVLTAILRRYQIPRNKYMAWDIPCAGGYLLQYDTLLCQAKILKKI